MLRVQRLRIVMLSVAPGRVRSKTSSKAFVPVRVRVSVAPRAARVFRIFENEDHALRRR